MLRSPTATGVLQNTESHIQHTTPQRTSPRTGMETKSETTTYKSQSKLRPTTSQKRNTDATDLNRWSRIKKSEPPSNQPNY